MAKQFKKKATKGELGSGIDALLGGRRLDRAMQEAPENTVRELSKQFAMLPITAISANPDQPRKEFEEEPLQELSDSIKVHGIIQPMTVRHMGDGTYQIISGERRFRASQRAGLKEVPAFIRTANDQTLLEMALIENIQRQDLNPMEIAYSYHRLQEEFSLTHDELAQRVGKKRSTVTNYLNILKVSQAVNAAIKNRKISIGAAKSIAGIKDLGLQDVFLAEILANPGWSVRDIEKEARKYKKEAKKAIPKTAKQAKAEEYKQVEQAFREFFGIKAVKIMLEDAEKEQGYVMVPFADKEVLHQLFKAVE